MCGIAGCVAAAGAEPDREALERMADALAPRGPDGRGVEVWENVGLVNRRLAIVDPGESGAQPISDPEGRWTMTFNGEVYNHAKLRDDLGGGWTGHSDSETLVRALAAWGEEAIPRCNGPLALAALDRRRRALLLARDRFGKKPLYMARDGRGIWFASEIRALLAAGLRFRPDRENLAHTAFRGWLSGTGTPLSGVDRLLPGSVCRIDIGSLDSSAATWFDVTDLVDPELGRHLATRSRPELAAELDRRLGVAVERRLMSDAPVGTMLSGGTDSSIVTAHAAARKTDLAAFTASLPFAGRADETRYAELAAAAAGVRLERVEFTRPEIMARLVRSVWVHEYPLLNAAIIMIEPIAARARDLGFKVLLTGEGADELFAGYEHLHIPETRRFLPAHATIARSASSLVHYRLRAVRSLLRRQGLLSQPERPFPPAARSDQLRSEALQRGRRAYAAHPPERRELEAALLSDLPASAFGHLLNRMDKNAMGASIETRLPFLDPDVAAFALNLPLELRVAIRPKLLLRMAARRRLPRRSALRRKQLSMSARLSRWLDDAADPAFLADGLLRELLGVERERWSELIRPSPGHSTVWSWTAEVWARLFIERHPVERVEAELWGD